jgi:hypothetical protein
MQHAPVVDEERVACIGERNRQSIDFGEEGPDLLAAGLSVPARRFEEDLVPPETVAILDLFAQAQQGKCAVLWPPRFDDRPGQNVERDGFDDGSPVSQQGWDVAKALNATQQQIAGRPAPMGEIGVKRKVVEAIDPATGVGRSSASTAAASRGLRAG